MCDLLGISPEMLEPDTIKAFEAFRQQSQVQPATLYTPTSPASLKEFVDLCGDCEGYNHGQIDQVVSSLVAKVQHLQVKSNDAEESYANIAVDFQILNLNHDVQSETLAQTIKDATQLQEQLNKSTDLLEAAEDATRAAEDEKSNLTTLVEFYKTQYDPASGGLSYKQISDNLEQATAQLDQQVDTIADLEAQLQKGDTDLRAKLSAAEYEREEERNKSVQLQSECDHLTIQAEHDLQGARTTFHHTLDSSLTLSGMSSFGQRIHWLLPNIAPPAAEMAWDYDSFPVVSLADVCTTKTELDWPVASITGRLLMVTVNGSAHIDQFDTCLWWVHDEFLPWAVEHRAGPAIFVLLQLMKDVVKDCIQGNRAINIALGLTICTRLYQLGRRMPSDRINVFVNDILSFGHLVWTHGLCHVCFHHFENVVSSNEHASSGIDMSIVDMVETMDQNISEKDEIHVARPFEGLEPLRAVIFYGDPGQNDIIFFDKPTETGIISYCSTSANVKVNLVSGDTLDSAIWDLDCDGFTFQFQKWASPSLDKWIEQRFGGQLAKKLRVAAAYKALHESQQARIRAAAQASS